MGAGSWRANANTVETYDEKRSAAASVTEADAVLEHAGRTEERLLRHLLGGNFDVDARGVNQTNTTVTVRIQFLLLRIQGLVSHISCCCCCYWR